MTAVLYDLEPLVHIVQRRANVGVRRVRGDELRDLSRSGHDVRDGVTDRLRVTRGWHCRRRPALRGRGQRVSLLK